MINEEFVVHGTGKLVEKGQIRFVGVRGDWRVCSFIVSYVLWGKEQPVICEAVKQAVDQIALSPIGEEISITGRIKGRQFNSEGIHIGAKYSIIVEVDTISCASIGRYSEKDITKERSEDD